MVTAGRPFHLGLLGISGRDAIDDFWMFDAALSKRSLADNMSAETFDDKLKELTATPLGFLGALLPSRDRCFMAGRGRHNDEIRSSYLFHP
jgi:hypothetical protein